MTDEHVNFEKVKIAANIAAYEFIKDTLVSNKKTSPEMIVAIAELLKSLE